MTKRRASVATMSRPMGSTQDVTKAIRFVLALNFRFYSLVFQQGYPLTFCTTNTMTLIIIAYLLFLFRSFYTVYIFRFLLHTGHREAAKFRFRTHDSQETIFQLRIPEVGHRKTGSYRVSNIIIDLDLNLLS